MPYKDKDDDIIFFPEIAINEKDIIWSQNCKIHRQLEKEFLLLGLDINIDISAKKIVVKWRFDNKIILEFGFFCYQEIIDSAALQNKIQSILSNIEEKQRYIFLFKKRCEMKEEYFQTKGPLYELNKKPQTKAVLTQRQEIFDRCNQLLCEAKKLGISGIDCI